MSFVIKNNKLRGSRYNEHKCSEKVSKRPIQNSRELKVDRMSAYNFLKKLKKNFVNKNNKSRHHMYNGSRCSNKMVIIERNYFILLVIYFVKRPIVNSKNSNDTELMHIIYVKMKKNCK